MKGRSPTFQQVPIDICGSTTFGRYPKISVSETINMIISDDWLAPYAGHLLVAAIVSQAEGRAIFSSSKYDHMIVVISNHVYTISSNLTATRVANIDTFTGDVYIDENNNSQIAICDKQNIYIYNYSTGVFSRAQTGGSPLNFLPGYITYQNGRFLSAALGTSQWRLSEIGNGLSWPDDSFHTALLQTKPDTVVATQRVPGRGNQLFVFGKTVTEIWQDIGAQLFPYQRNSALNIDYGCLNAATIAFNENIVVWLAANEKSGPMIAFSTGGDINKISTDGIDFKFTQLKNPSNSYGFLFRQDGHQLYQLTFPDDNLTYVYDFNTQKFFTLKDENMNAHIAKRVSFFNDKYYFVSFTDGNLYQFGTEFTTYNGAEIPRIRICKDFRFPDASRFSVNNLTFTLEQGTQNNILLDNNIHLVTQSRNQLNTQNGNNLITQRSGSSVAPIPQQVGLSVSKDGGMTFGTIWTKDLNPRGNFRNRLIYWNLGAANDFVLQFRFWGMGRFVATDGLMDVYQ